MTPFNRLRWLLPLACAALWGCVDSGCPEGSSEVDGTCMQDKPEKDGAAENDDGSGGSGDGSKPPSDAGAKPGGRGSQDAESLADDHDGSTSDASNVSPNDAGDAADAGSDAGPTCADLACDEHASCDEAASPATCVCEPGYEGDGLACADIDECTTSTDDCDANADCTNTEGSFECECKPGFEGDGKTCTANPCEERVNPCDLTTTTCRADDDEAVCDCLEGLGRCDEDEYACNADLLGDAQHCGSCELACAGELECAEGLCEQRVVALSLGAQHSCAVDPVGQVLCWGNNSSYELGRASGGTPNYEPAEADIDPVKQMDCGSARSCARTEADELVCWGTNIAGSLSTTDMRYLGIFPIAQDVAGMDEVAVGGAAICGRYDGAIACWSISLGGSLGTTTIANNEIVSYDDANVFAVAAPAGLAVGNRLGCAVTSSGAVTCWGDGRSAPATISNANGNPISDVVAVEASLISSSQNGNDSACALLESGQVACWGYNDKGQLGNLNNTASYVDYALTVSDANSFPLEDAVEVGVGAHHACARRSGGSVVCWGQRDRLGNGSSGTGAQRSFVDVEGIDDAVELAVGMNHSCVRRASGQVQCWGDNAHGELGVDPEDTPFALMPINVIGLP